MNWNLNLLGGQAATFIGATCPRQTHHQGSDRKTKAQEGHAGLDGGQMGHGNQIHNLLHAGSGHHGNAGGAAGHHILMIAEDVVGLLCHGPGRHMEHGGHPMTGHDMYILGIISSRP